MRCRLVWRAISAGVLATRRFTGLSRTPAGGDPAICKADLIAICRADLIRSAGEEALNAGIDIQPSIVPAAVADRRAPHAARRGAARADGGLHRFVRGAEFRDAQGHAVSE